VAVLAIKNLIEAGLHFGHAASSWNPRMKPFLLGIKKKVHILDLKQTAKSLVAAKHLAHKYAAEGKVVMFVGTKVQAQQSIRDAAVKTKGFYVCERWLGGMLTNFQVILRRLDRLAELEHIEAEESHNYSKKLLSSFKREQKKLQRDLGGVRGMTRLPDLMVVIDPKHEHIAVKEANICNIPVIALTDSNCDPTPIDLVIPGNDDAKRGIQLVLEEIVESVLDGQKVAEASAENASAKEEPAAEEASAETTETESTEEKVETVEA
jgi:small subunit ribosomal protein S2